MGPGCSAAAGFSFDDPVEVESLGSGIDKTENVVVLIFRNIAVWALASIATLCNACSRACVVRSFALGNEGFTATLQAWRPGFAAGRLWGCEVEGLPDSSRQCQLRFTLLSSPVLY